MEQTDGDMVSREGSSRPPYLVSTLGMFIIDQFRFEDEVTGEDLGDRGLGNQIGGGGTYFAIGARMWLPPSAVMMTIDRGRDFSTKEQQMMDHYAQPILQSQEHHRLWRYRDRNEETTRAVNIYRGEERGFAYLTPKLRLDPNDLLSEEFPYFPTFIHCICSPDRATEIVKQIDEREKHWYNGIRPTIIWEPIPDSATSENLQECLNVMPHIDVLSPNHEEVANFLSIKKSQISGKEARQSIRELLLDRIFDLASSAKLERVPIICIRSGSLGALVGTSQDQAVWVEAYHTSEKVHRVVDVTGAGNAWLGGFTAGLAMVPRKAENEPSWTLEELKKAAQMGSVSASFVVEQQSLPTLSIDQSGLERWNNEQAKTRLHHLQQRWKNL